MKTNIHIFACTVLLFLLNTIYLYSEDSLSSSKKLLPEKVISDTTKKTKSDSTIKKDSGPKMLDMKKSWINSILWSAAFPGLGQVYVESYWKAPLFAGGFGTLIYFAIKNNSDYKNYYNQWQQAKDAKESFITISELYRYREYYHDVRDEMIFYAGVVYIFAMVDSYVGAHLFDFDVSDKITASLKIDFLNGQPMCGLKFSF
ncbi:MAG: DUF5683 domain-containing protein [Candidatus Kapabacteria bacterium]|nr:DUF5683 domain-containing protein [Candidatus Kapabacteria bacterium]